jgi:Ras homolog enriched in brain
MVIVGNKCDLRPEQRQVEREAARALADELDCAFTEASARFDENVGKAFDLIIGEIERAQNPAQEPAKSTCEIM